MFKIRGPKSEEKKSEHNYSKALEIIVGLLCLEFIKLLHKSLEINELIISLVSIIVLDKECN